MTHRYLLHAGAAVICAGLTLAVCPAASASCLDGIYDEPLPVTAVAPSDGASVPASPSVPVMFSITSPAPPMNGLDALSITVTTQNVMGNTGILSDLNEADAVALPESGTNWGVYRGVSNVGPTLWTNTPGTYYWQAFGMFSYYDQAAGQIVCDARASQVYTITIAAPPSSGGTGNSSSGTTPTAPPSPPMLTFADARRYAAFMVYQHTHRDPRGTISCPMRINAATLRCNVDWTTRRYRYRASGKFWNYLRPDGTARWSYDFRGTRISRACESQSRHRRRHARHHRRHRRRCVSSFRWH